MNDALVLMHGRNIPECLDALDELDIPIIYMTGYTERQIADTAFPLALEHDYDWLWIASDDIIIRPHALEAVRRIRDQNHPVVTGYSQGSHTDWTVNLTSEPIRANLPLGPGSYTFRDYQQCVAWPESTIPTWFTGMSLTGMSREMWQAFPFDCIGNPGWASDFVLSNRLQEANIPIVAARDAFCYHWRHNRIYGDQRDAIFLFGRTQRVELREPIAA